MKTIELLAPAGSPEALTAAVRNGADAVYLGYGAFNARRKAKNFDAQSFEEGIKFCHQRGAKVFLTLNTLVTDRELPEAVETATFASEKGIDAILVQDIGLLFALKKALPNTALHASTQMSIHSLSGVRFCEELGLERVVLSRELSKDAISHICQHSKAEIEVFVHGALCMAYSGQCFLSSMVGGRSGNRGLCAQPCRLAYDWGDGKKCSPLSLKDLSLVDHLKELKDMGVACLKLEGRMKRPEYVAIVTKIYSDILREERAPTKEEALALEEAFSREGFTQGYYHDQKTKDMFGTRKEEDRISPALLAKAKESYTGKEQPFIPLFFYIDAQLDAPISLTLSDDEGRSVTVTGAICEEAKTRAITEEQIETQLGKTGGTLFYPETIMVSLGENISLPIKALNALRRDGLEAMIALRNPEITPEIHPFTPAPKLKNKGDRPCITLSILHFYQLSEALLDLKPHTIYLPIEEIAKNQKELATFMAQYPEINFALIMPRIFWDREETLLRHQLETAKNLGIKDALIGTWGAVSLCRESGFSLRGDFSLGIMNGLSLASLKYLGFVSAMLSFELNFSQIRDISKSIDTEILSYGRQSMMLMEHCITSHHDDCQHCDKAHSLTDRKGITFPVTRAYGCRSELLNGNTLYLADKKEDYTALGIWGERLSFTTEGPLQCVEIFKEYCGLEETFPPEDMTRGLYYRKVE